MRTRAACRPASLPLVLLFLSSAACSGQGRDPNAITAPTAATHRAFPIAEGPHAVDCAACHGTFASFAQFDCLGCHSTAAAAAVHTTTTGYADTSAACLGCHANPTAHPFDHAGVTTCAGCHDAGGFYPALPKAGFTHPATSGEDCSKCHTNTTWTSAERPAGVVADPLRAVTLTALVPRYSGTSVVALSPQPETLPMGMDHATTQVPLSGVACSTCHADQGAGVFYPGRLHSSLANLGVAQPTACSDCHAASAPTGFVGPVAASPARTPPSGEMKHDAVLWSSGAPTTTRAVTADCGVCHASPSAALQATWATGASGTSPARFHAALTAAARPQPASCLDCHANGRPVAPLTSSTAALRAGLTFDHAAAAAKGDCAACHAATATSWAGGRFHLAGSATPTSCLPCHDGERPTSAAGWSSPGYAAAPFDYGTNPAGVTHGDGQDCAVCHAGPGAGGAWGGTQTWAGGKFTHGPATVAADTCIVCHASQRPDLVLGAAQAAAALGGFDHSASSSGDCIGCHQATVAAGSYVNYDAPGGGFPGGDWKGGAAYPGSTLVTAPDQFVTVTALSLVRASPGALVTGMTSTQATLTNAMLHTSAAVPPQLSPGPASAPDLTTCWHCHTHDATGRVTSYAGGQYHASLDHYAATVGGAVTPLPQPTGRCLDCHAQMHPVGVVELAASDLQPMDHAALFTGTVTIAGQTVAGVAGLDCSTCHRRPGDRWSDGAFHASIGAAVPADCTACHYPLMADAPRADVASGTSFVMAHASGQLAFQACSTCHASALAGSTTSPVAATAWKPGAFHASVAAQPTACLDCHAVSEPPPGSPTQSSVTYALAAGGTASNAGQWMNHGAITVVGKDCAACHAADARSAGSAWSKADLFHAVVPAPATCRECHGLTNGGGAVAGTGNNLPAGLTSASMVTSAAADPLTGIPAGTRDQILHADVNVGAQDCARCHTQAGQSTAPGIQGAEWAQARFHASLSPAIPLVMNGTTGRCSNCHLNVKPGPGITAQDHAAFSAVAGTQDCSACHSWPGTGSAAAPNWLGATAMPQFIAVGGFAIPQPPAAVATTQQGIASLPHPTVATGTSCATCHTGGVGGKGAVGYDHASALINANCSSCHEAGSDLLGTPWNLATTQGAGAGDTRPYTLTTIVATRGSSADRCTITLPNHFFAVDCAECHAVPAGNGAVTTGAAYASAWFFPHTQSKMANPSTCNLCHVGQNCAK